MYELTHQLDLKSTDYKGEAPGAKSVSELELILVLVDELMTKYWKICRLLFVNK